MFPLLPAMLEEPETLPPIILILLKRQGWLHKRLGLQMCSPKDKYKVQEQYIIKNKKAVQKQILKFYKTKQKECA